MEYVTQGQFKVALQNIDKIKEEIQRLKENKADKEVLQNIKQDIAVLTKSIEDMHSDRAEDKEAIKKLTDEVKSLSNIINGFNIDTVEMKVNQKNIDEKIVDLKSDISSLSADMQAIKSSLDNSLWNIFCKLYKQYMFVRVCTKFLIAMFIVIMFSSCFFYVSNGIPWDKIRSIRGWIG